MIKYFLVKKGKIRLRVISGERKGHKLKAPKGREVRPTEDRIKESLFNIIRPLSLDAIVLDLFGGSGGIGIEFLSRGAKIAYFVDISNDSISIIKENLIHTNLIDKSIILNKDALRAINFLKDKNVIFDYIYLDPPFKNHELLLKTIDSISINKLLSNEGVIIIEHEKELALETEINNFTRYDFRNYGSKSLSFYRNKEV
jgi:16S rRNA (guanine(966)-N(2))-methyltransferase RsmD